MARLKQIAGASGRSPLPLTEGGPPDIQTLAIITADGVVIREPTVKSTDWRDPDDPTSHLRREGARYIHGFRRVWTIDSLHTASPREITERHVKAATRLLDDYQRSLGAVSGGRPLDRVDNSRTDLGSIDLRIRAAKSYEEAIVVMAECAILVFHVAILNNSLRDTATRFDGNRDKLHGRLSGALGRLAEHYWPTQRQRVLEPVHDTPEPTDDMAERLGRWRK